MSNFLAKDVYNVVQEGLLLQEELDEYYARLCMMSFWMFNQSQGKTRQHWWRYSLDYGENGRVLDLQHGGDAESLMQFNVQKAVRYSSEELAFIDPILELLVQLAEGRSKTWESDVEIIPLGWSLNYYKDPDDSIPAHHHFCRQLTFTVGADQGRLSTVWRKNIQFSVGSRMPKEEFYGAGHDVDYVVKSYPVKAGDISFLEGEKHGAPKGPGKRMSFNLFYTTTTDLLAGGVQMNPRQEEEWPPWITSWRNKRNQLEKQNVAAREEAAASSKKTNRWTKKGK